MWPIYIHETSPWLAWSTHRWIFNPEPNPNPTLKTGRILSLRIQRHTSTRVICTAVRHIGRNRTNAGAPSAVRVSAICTCLCRDLLLYRWFPPHVHCVPWAVTQSFCITRHALFCTLGGCPVLVFLWCVFLVLMLVSLISDAGGVPMQPSTPVTNGVFQIEGGSWLTHNPHPDPNPD